MEKSKAKEKVKYVDTLDKETRDRYLDKIRHLNGTDPYEVRSWSTDPEKLPPLSCPDLYSYLVLGISAYTMQEFKSFKSLEAHVKFTNGWVQDIKSYTPDDCDNTVMHAKVLHSQRLCQKLLNPWVIVHKDGTVVTAHCDCRAGLAETCSHVSALLFKLEAVVRIRERTTVTGQPAYWMIPSAVSRVEPEVGYKIDFTTAAAKKKAVDRLISGEIDSPQGLRTACLPRASTTSAPTEAETEKFLRDLHKTGDKAVLLSMKREYCKDFVDPIKPVTAVKSLRGIRNPKLDGTDYTTLLQHCSKLKNRASLSQEQADKLERSTREQTKSSEWYSAKAGRITASQMYAVSSTNVDKPAVSTVSAVCYPERSRTVNTPATQWGMLHEGTARQAYMKAAQQEHEGLTVEKSGLIVNPDFPFVGASPDGIVSCACCGARSVCLEIKCPFKHKSVTIREACADKHFCLEVVDDHMSLKKEHRYYAQIQCQMFVGRFEVCDFVVWTEVDICIIRIDADEAFWSHCLEKASVFFEKVCLPELVARHFTCGGKKPAANTKTGKSSQRQPLCPSPQKGSTTASSSKRESSVSPSKQRQRKRKSKKLWCSCRKTEDYDNMVACENENCEVQWYHLCCVGLNHTPGADEVWFCPTCTQGGQ